MLISHSSRSSDPVVMSRIIARTMLQEMASSPENSASRISVINMLRLLEMYQFDSFRSRQPLGILEHHRSNELSTSSGQSGFDRLRKALIAVHDGMLHGTERAEFSKRIGEALVKFIPPEQGQPVREPSQADIELVTNFLEKLKVALSTSPA